jgi:hypothetical protein
MERNHRKRTDGFLHRSSIACRWRLCFVDRGKGAQGGLQRRISIIRGGI